jgi:hypothetical protein
VFCAGGAAALKGLPDDDIRIRLVFRVFRVLRGGDSLHALASRGDHVLQIVT